VGEPVLPVLLSETVAVSVTGTAWYGVAEEVCSCVVELACVMVTLAAAVSVTV
jgi:hypothetical protein